MKRYFLLGAFLVLLSCSTVKEGFQNDKKNNSDEFLVEKKSPLVMPPDFEKLPMPSNKEEKTKVSQNQIKEMIQSQEISNTENVNSKKLEESMLDKIKKN